MSVMTNDKAMSEKQMIAAAETALADISRAREAIGEVIFGQESVVERTLVALLAGGHALLVGVPGLAKTKLVETLGAVLGLDARRVQFTPDLMPSDILGSEVLEEDENRKRSFRFIPGPIFAQLLMADEINRASPRTQSAPSSTASCCRATSFTPNWRPSAASFWRRPASAKPPPATS